MLQGCAYAYSVCLDTFNLSTSQWLDHETSETIHRHTPPCTVIHLQRLAWTCRHIIPPEPSRCQAMNASTANDDENAVWGPGSRTPLVAWSVAVLEQQHVHAKDTILTIAAICRMPWCMMPKTLGKTMSLKKDGLDNNQVRSTGNIWHVQNSLQKTPKNA